MFDSGSESEMGNSTLPQFGSLGPGDPIYDQSGDDDYIDTKNIPYSLDKPEVVYNEFLDEQKRLEEDATQLTSALQAQANEMKTRMAEMETMTTEMTDLMTVVTGLTAKIQKSRKKAKSCMKALTGLQKQMEAHKERVSNFGKLHDVVKKLALKAENKQADDANRTLKRKKEQEDAEDDADEDEQMCKELDADRGQPGLAWKISNSDLNNIISLLGNIRRNPLRKKAEDCDADYRLWKCLMNKELIRLVVREMCEGPVRDFAHAMSKQSKKRVTKRRKKKRARHPLPPKTKKLLLKQENDMITKIMDRVNEILCTFLDTDYSKLPFEMQQVVPFLGYYKVQQQSLLTYMNANFKGLSSNHLIQSCAQYLASRLLLPTQTTNGNGGSLHGGYMTLSTIQKLMDNAENPPKWLTVILDSQEPLKPQPDPMQLQITSVD